MTRMAISTIMPTHTATRRPKLSGVSPAARHEASGGRRVSAPWLHAAGNVAVGRCPCRHQERPLPLSQSGEAVRGAGHHAPVAWPDIARPVNIAARDGVAHTSMMPAAYLNPPAPYNTLQSNRRAPSGQQGESSHDNHGWCAPRPTSCEMWRRSAQQAGDTQHAQAPAAGVAAQFRSRACKAAGGWWPHPSQTKASAFSSWVQYTNGMRCRTMRRTCGPAAAAAAEDGMRWHARAVLHDER
jgi:hypothetical protein